MKPYWIIALLIAPLFAGAQANGRRSGNTSFLFESFIEGKVYFKSGKVETSMLNYDTGGQAVLFSRDNQFWILDQLPLIDSICIGHKKFIPYDKRVYEEIGRNGDTLLLVTYRARPKPRTATADHTGSNTQSAGAVSNTVSDYYLGRNYQGDRVMEVLPSYWLLQGNRLFKVNTEKQWKELYEDRGDRITDFFKSNNLRASEMENMPLYVTLFRNLSL